MSQNVLKIFSLVLLFIGESMAIYAEVAAARIYGTQSFLGIFLKMFLFVSIAGGFLIAGYMLGFLSFKNIWVVSVASITSILIMEPIIVYAVFHELPTRGALVGLILGSLGFLATVLF